MNTRLVLLSDCLASSLGRRRRAAEGLSPGTQGHDTLSRCGSLEETRPDSLLGEFLGLMG